MPAAGVAVHGPCPLELFPISTTGRLRLPPEIHMTARDEEPENKMSSDGLRYPAKKPGFTFGGPVLGSTSATMSCFRCGRPKPRQRCRPGRFRGATRRSAR